MLFQSYADRGEWEAGLRAMDKAIADMPRTNHRLLIYKHLVVIKAKLGLNVGMSIQKFKVSACFFSRFTLSLFCFIHICLPFTQRFLHDMKFREVSFAFRFLSRFVRVRVLLQVIFHTVYM